MLPKPRGQAPADFPHWDSTRGVWHDGHGNDRPAATRNQRRVQQRSAGKKRQRDDLDARAQHAASLWLDPDMLLATMHQISLWPLPTPQDFDRLSMLYAE